MGTDGTEEYLEKLYEKILDKLGKPIHISSNGKLQYNCPVCKHDKLYITPYVGYCHYEGKTYLLNDLKTVLDIEHNASPLIKHNFIQRTAIPNYITDKLTIHDVYKEFYSVLTPPWAIEKPVHDMKQVWIDKTIRMFEHRDINTWCHANGAKIPVPGTKIKDDKYYLSFIYPSLLFFYIDSHTGLFSGINAKILNDKFAFRYMWATGGEKRLFFPSDSINLSNVQAITEGEKKAIIVSQAGIKCIGLSGVNCFKTPEWELVPPLKNKKIYILFDPPEGNEHILIAENKLFYFLTELGYKPIIIKLPLKVDDYIIKHGRIKFLFELGRQEIETRTRAKI